MDVTEIEAHKASSVLPAFEQSYVKISLLSLPSSLGLWIFIACNEFIVVGTLYINRSHLRE